MDVRRLLRNLLLWLVPVAVVWLALTPVYNRFLVRGVENLVQLGESPNKTRLRIHDTHYALVYHRDARTQTSTGHVSSFRVTDIQFTVIFAAVLCLAVPGAPLRRRLEALGWSLLAMAAFQLLLGVFWVKFVYATQLGSWSMEHYGAFARNFWGLGKHVLDLAFKFALPFMLWCPFFLRELLPAAKEASA